MNIIANSRLSVKSPQAWPTGRSKIFLICLWSLLASLGAYGTTDMSARFFLSCLSTNLSVLLFKK